MEFTVFDVNLVIRAVDIGRGEIGESRIRVFAVSEIIPEIDLAISDGEVLVGPFVVAMGPQISDQHQIGMAAVTPVPMSPVPPAFPAPAVIDVLGVVIPVIVETKPVGGTGLHASGVHDTGMDSAEAAHLRVLAGNGGE